MISKRVHTAFGPSSMLKRLYTKPVTNKAIVEEEMRGSGSSLVGCHVTEITDRGVRQRIMQMSVLEIIS